MSVANRYSDLIFAVQRWGRAHQTTVTMITEPEDRHFPLVFALRDADRALSSDPLGGILFLFTPGEQLLTSDVLAFLIQHINQYACPNQPIALFADDEGRAVQRALAAAGLHDSLELHNYAYRGGKFGCSWQPDPLRQSTPA